MAGYNRIILIGNLTRDPEYKQLASGQGVCRLGLATNRQFKNRQSGSMTQEVCYIDVDVWGAQADSCRQYLQKGRPVLVEGRLKFDTWEDQNKQTRSRHTVVADRVVFMSSQGGAAEGVDEVGKSSMESEPEAFQLNPNNPIERDLMNQLEKAKAKIQGATKEPVAAPKTPAMAPKQTASGEVEFADQAPFEDDLPF